MHFKGQILSEEEQARIHRESLNILSGVGVKFYGEKALPLLEKHCAKVDWESKIARLPGGLVEETLQAAPKSFILGARNPVYDYPLPSPVSRYCIDGTAAFAMDFLTGKRRYGTLKDIENGLRVFQQLEMGVMAWAPTCASEVPAHSRPLHEFFAMMKYSSKHGEHELHRHEQVPYLLAGLKAVLGGEAEVRARKAYSLIYCPVAPLTHDGAMLDAYLDLGQYEMPVMIMPMPVNGTTGPASLFANLCQANAEALSALVVYQLANPGRPLIYSSATGSVDFRNGAYMGGTPEMGLQSAAMVEMGRYYGLPSSSAGCTSDAREPGAQAVLEKLVTTFPPVSVGSDIIVGFGEIESDQLLILEQLVVDDELARFCERIVAGVDSNLAHDLYADIARIGPGGNFLKSPQTRLAARSKEFFTPSLISHHSYEAWLNMGKPTMYNKARERVEGILAAPLVDPMPESISRELDEILLAADKELAE